jgi:hypothetical protein
MVSIFLLNSHRAGGQTLRIVSKCRFHTVTIGTCADNSSIQIKADRGESEADSLDIKKTVDDTNKKLGEKKDES